MHTGTFHPRAVLASWVLFVAVALLGCATRPVVVPSTRPEPIVLADDLHLRPLADGVWLHVSSKVVEGWGRVPSNGLIVQGEGGVLLVDTPWTPEQTHMLLEWTRRTLGLPIVEVIVTHFHDDRTGGVAALPPGVRIHALPTTAALSAADGRPFVASPLESEASWAAAGTQVETFFPGAGHTEDNLVVWLPEQRLLHGGCFVKDAASTTLGNVADADLPSWGKAVVRVQARYPDVAMVVPGHGSPGGAELLTHTATLLEARAD